VKELRAVSPCRQAMDCLAWLTGAYDTFIPYELYGFPGYRFLKLKSLDNPTSMILRRVEDMYVPFFSKARKSNEIHAHSHFRLLCY
jgi:hypothetical protein